MTNLQDTSCLSLSSRQLRLYRCGLSLRKRQAPDAHNSPAINIHSFQSITGIGFGGGGGFSGGGGGSDW